MLQIILLKKFLLLKTFLWIGSFNFSGVLGVIVWKCIGYRQCSSLSTRPTRSGGSILGVGVSDLATATHAKACF